MSFLIPCLLLLQRGVGGGVEGRRGGVDPVLGGLLSVYDEVMLPTSLSCLPTAA